MKKSTATIDMFDLPAPVLDRREARKKRDEGIKRVTDSANRKVPGWSDTAYKFLRDYMRTHEEFMTEDVRVASMDKITQPPNNKAWGQVMLRARREGLILPVRYVSQKSVSCHGSPKPVWRVL